MTCRALMCPPIRRRGEQVLHRLVAEALPCLGDGAPRRGLVLCRWKRQIKRLDHALDGLVAQQRHAEHDPDHLLGGQPATTHRGGARRCERLCDPVRIDVLPESAEFGRHQGIRQRLEIFGEGHGDLRGDRGIMILGDALAKKLLPIGKIAAATITWGLSDRYWA